MLAAADISRDMSGDRVIPPARVARPTSREEVQTLVREAQRAAQPFYVIASGRNWGYAERGTLTHGALLIDLSGMAKILAVDEALGSVTLEPGVTQGQLARYLAEHHPKLWMDCSGAGPDASVVGNLLERGFGHTPYGDRFEQCAGLEVVLGTGEILRTGFGAYPGCDAATTYGHGVGPNLKGLFTQSNFGVVTQATLWLMPKPEAFEAFFLPISSGLGAVVDELARLQLEGTLRSKIHIANDLRAASNRGPRESKTALDPVGRQRVRQTTGAGAWNISGGLYGAKAVVKAQKQRLKRSAIKGRWLFVSPRTERVLGFFARVLGKGGAWHGATTVLALLRGQPVAAPLAATQWATRAPDVATALRDPAATDAGLVWIAPVLPARGAIVEEAVALTESVLGRHGFDPLITLTMINPRSLCLILQLAFDASSAEQRAAARACHDELLAAYLRRGFVPYRSHPWGHAALRAGAPEFWAIAARLKRVFDPAGVVCPERYVG